MLDNEFLTIPIVRMCNKINALIRTTPNEGLPNGRGKKSLREICLVLRQNRKRGGVKSGGTMNVVQRVNLTAKFFCADISGY